MDDNVWKDGDRVRIRKDQAMSFHQPFRGFGLEGRPGTLRIYERKGWRGVEVNLEVTFDVKRKGATPQKMLVHKTDIEKVPD